MAQTVLGPGKKRISITVTESVVTRFQTICKEGNLPPATLSRSIDDFLKGMVDVLERARKAGKFTISDWFALMGEQMELLQEEKPDVKQTPKTKALAKNPVKRK